MSDQKIDIENPRVICTECNQPKVKKFKKYHQSPDKANSTKKRRKFEDENGFLWHGTLCPECAATRRKNKYSEKNNKERELLQEKLIG